ncbi:MAG: hypothetical protein WAW54_02370 [Parvibaculum sedimenti]
MTILPQHDEIEKTPQSFKEEYGPQIIGGAVALAIFALIFLAFMR